MDLSGVLIILGLGRKTVSKAGTATGGYPDHLMRGTALLPPVLKYLHHIVGL